MTEVLQEEDTFRKLNAYKRVDVGVKGEWDLSGTGWGNHQGADCVISVCTNS